MHKHIMIKKKEVKIQFMLIYIKEIMIIKNLDPIGKSPEVEKILIKLF